MISAQSVQTFCVQWTDKTGIHNRCVNSLIQQFLTNLHSSLNHTAHCHKGNLLTLKHQLTLAVFNRRPHVLKAFIGTAPRISNGDRPMILIGKIKHIIQFVFILRCTDGHIRYHRQIRQVKYALMSLTISTNQSGSIHAEYNRQVLNTHIVDNLVIRPLQER